MSFSALNFRELIRVVSEPTPEMQKAAHQWRAQEFVDEQRAAKPVEAFEAAQNPSPESPAGFGHGDLASLVWLAASILGKRYGGDRFELTADEQAQLAKATEPVLLKYLPVVPSTGPEVALFVVAAAIYGPKLTAEEPAPLAVPA